MKSQKRSDRGFADGVLELAVQQDKAATLFDLEGKAWHCRPRWRSLRLQQEHTLPPPPPPLKAARQTWHPHVRPAAH